MTDEHLIQIESKLAHQEHTIAELNDALTSQQSQLMALERQVGALANRVQTLTETIPSNDTKQETPPHY